MFYKNEKEKYFVYLLHTVCDYSNFIFGFNVILGNINDSISFNYMFENVMELYRNELLVATVYSRYKISNIEKIIL